MATALLVVASSLSTVLFLPSSYAPNFTLVLDIPWANGTFWSDCDVHPPRPWTLPTSSHLYSLASTIKPPYLKQVIRVNMSLTPFEFEQSKVLFAQFLHMQTIIVPDYCTVARHVVDDWRNSPYTFAKAVLLHRPVITQGSSYMSYYTTALAGPFILFLYMVTKRK